MNKMKRLFILIGCVCLVSAIGCGKEEAEVLSDLPSEEASLTDDSENQKATEDAAEADAEDSRGLALVRVGDIPAWNTSELNEGEQDAYIDEFMGEGVSRREPDYTCYMENEETMESSQVDLWYDLEQDKGCGIYQNAYGIWGFAFEGHMTLEWKARDIFDLGLNDYNLDGISNCQEFEEYDDAGRLISNWVVADYEYQDESKNPVTILSARYQYREAGTVEQKHFHHNLQVFGTWESGQVSHYDEEERLIYVNSYVTDGIFYEFLIYTDEPDRPSFALTLEYSHGPVPFFYVYE